MFFCHILHQFELSVFKVHTEVCEDLIDSTLTADSVSFQIYMFYVGFFQTQFCDYSRRHGLVALHFSRQSTYEHLGQTGPRTLKFLLKLLYMNGIILFRLQRYTQQALSSAVLL